MNKHSKLLAILDEVFGAANKTKSQFRKIRQGFDENTNEHVVVIEYRYRRKGEMRTTPRLRKRNLKLLRQVNDQAR